jgi:two-component system, NarL family, nitrate/nitrite response regulator NarL
MVEVFVVAPIRVHRESLCVALNEAETLNVAGGAATLAEALPRIRQLGPQVALLDASAPADVDATLLPASEPEVKLVAVGVPEDEAVEWIEAGASGYIPPDASLDDLADAVTRVARGELVTSREVTAHILDRIRAGAAEVPVGANEARLTPREAEVLDLAAEGLPDKLIAQRLSIQVQTVKNHMQKILRKFGVHGRGAAVARIRRTRRRSRGQ